MDRVVVLDGYDDEPAGLGVPPYLDIYARYVAGAIWLIDSSIDVKYLTIDQVRRDWSTFIKLVSSSRLLVVLAGIVTPGKYLGGDPIKLRELVEIGRLEVPKMLGGPVARFGFGAGGGSIAVPRSFFSKYYDLVVTGDIDLAVHEVISRGFSLERISPAMIHATYAKVNEFAVKGARIVTQHPNYGGNLIVELETYKSCPRYVSGGCSFCATVRYGGVEYRDEEAIMREVEALYLAGVRHFRVGRQADILTYKAIDTGKLDFPRPNPDAIDRLFRGIRSAAPGLNVLHIDNVNPGTIYAWPRESRESLKAIIRSHTPGDVAAMGIESADPRVIKLNNLKILPDEAIEAMKIVNEVGAGRGDNGLPHLLPGINFVAGLPGETKETYELNKLFLLRVMESGILVRRVNMRQVLVLEPTPLWTNRSSIRSLINKHKRFFLSLKNWVRTNFDLEMIRRIAPKGTILRNAYVEAMARGGVYARQVGSYPILIYVPQELELGKWIDVVVVDHGPRSLVGLPIPININTAPGKILMMVPGLTRDKVNLLLRNRPFKSIEEVKNIIQDVNIPSYLASLP